MMKKAKLNSYGRLPGAANGECRGDTAKLIKERKIA
jgi:hypothetical protein